MNQIASILTSIRKKSPLVHNITNYVVMNNTANALLAVGASPVMAHAKEEVKDIVTISSALVINMGTLSTAWVESMKLAAQTAKDTKTPFVFDPVGVGASYYRTETAQQIIATHTPDVIRGNASEIIALINSTLSTKGVDSSHDSLDAVNAAKQLSKELGNTIVVSGEKDIIITGEKVSTISNGDALMAKITGMGCTATAIVGACIAVEKDTHLAATAAMAIMGVTGDMSKTSSKGPGSFQMNFIDNLHLLTTDQLSEYLKLDE
jgi:hydroxyethylthiazole kinase